MRVKERKNRMVLNGLESQGREDMQVKNHKNHLFRWESNDEKEITN